jgi:diguanylate cyclase (GGDEF)-like protein
MLDNEVERARRSGNRLGVVIAEIDGMSPVATGPTPAPHQRVLASVGGLFRSAPRQIDMAARLGGSRFGLLLPYTDEHGAYLLAERLRERIGALEPIEGKPISVSFGVAGFPRNGASGHAIFQGAEAALEAAKAAGGGRVMLLQRSASSAVVEIETPEELLG